VARRDAPLAPALPDRADEDLSERTARLRQVVISERVGLVRVVQQDELPGLRGGRLRDVDGDLSPDFPAEGIVALDLLAENVRDPAGLVGSGERGLIDDGDANGQSGTSEVFGILRPGSRRDRTSSQGIRRCNGFGRRRCGAE